MDGSVSPGRVLAGRYRLGQLLGRGGMAEVYGALDLRLERPVALKLLREELAASAAMRERFEREARSAARLSHPNVVAVYDSGEDGGEAFLVMERLPGDSVASVLAKRGRADPPWVRRVALDVLAALDAAHSIGIVHRDIKPGNILLAADGRAKVADFGIAKAFGGNGEGASDPSLTATGLIVGTAAYLAPERVEGRPATPLSDIYSLGVVMYELLGGRKPFEGESPLQVAYAARHHEAPDLAALAPGAGQGLIAVVKRAMAVQPEERFASARAMAAELEALPATSGGWGAPVLAPTERLEGPPGEQALASPVAADGRTAVLDSPSRAHNRPSAARSRRRWALLGAGVALAGLVAGLVAAETGGGGSPLRAGAAAPATTAPPSSSTTSTTSAPSTTAPAATLAQDPAALALARYADSLEQSDAPGAAQLASALLGVAEQPEGPSRVDAAAQALTTATNLYEQGAISGDQYSKAVQLLEQAVAPAVLPGAPAAQPGPGKHGGPGKQNGQGDS